MAAVLESPSGVGAPAPGASPRPGGDLLVVNGIEVIYNHVILVLKGVSLIVPRGGIVALLGANGAGKTTTLRAVSNLLRAERGEVSKGSIVYDGQRVERLTPYELVRRGVVQVMEGRRCFGHLTIEENLLTGAYTGAYAGRAAAGAAQAAALAPDSAAVRPAASSRSSLAEALERVYAYFPRLKTRRGSLAGYTSGGEQQMCAIGRALMARPSMILLDEPSMGLAPQVVEEIFGIVHDLNAREGVSFLLAEQNASLALRYARHGYILESGRVVMDGSAAALADNEDVKEFYLGLSRDGRRSFRDAKFYRRRKRWLA